MGKLIKQILFFVLLFSSYHSAYAANQYENFETKEINALNVVVNKTKVKFEQTDSSKLHPEIQEKAINSLDNMTFKIPETFKEKYLMNKRWGYYDTKEDKIYINKDVFTSEEFADEARRFNKTAFEYLVATLAHEITHSLGYGEGKAYAVEAEVGGIDERPYEYDGRYVGTSAATLEETVPDPGLLESVGNMLLEDLNYVFDFYSYVYHPFRSLFNWLYNVFNDAVKPDESFAVDSASYPVVPCFSSDVSALVLVSTFYEGSVNMLERYGYGTALTDYTTPPGDLIAAAPVLILPSGSLSGLDNSEVFKAVLQEYVKQGGTVVCFAQQYGYEFGALPGGEVAGFGWMEDQACHANAVYVSRDHPVFAGQTIKDIDAAVDGYFTHIPDNAQVLLRRTKNTYPAMITYEYGQGRVIATDMYEDWAYGHSQSTEQARALIRDIVGWAKNPELREYNPGAPASLNITLESADFLSEDAVSATVYYVSAEAEVVSSEVVELAVPLAPGQNVDINYTLNIPADAELGISRLDYDLLNSEGEVIQPRAEGTSFAVKLPELGGGVRLPDYQMWITSYDERLQKGAEAHFTIHMRNNTQSDLVSAGLFQSLLTRITDINIPADSEIVYEHSYSATLIPTIQRFDLKDSAGNSLASAKRIILFPYYKVSASVSLSALEYEKSQTVDGVVNIANKTLEPPTDTSTPLELLSRVTVLDKTGTIIYAQDIITELSWEDSSSAQVPFSFSLPEDALSGRYSVRVDVFSGEERVSAAVEVFNIPAIVLSIEPGYPAEFNFTDSHVISYTLNNLSTKPADDVSVTLKLKGPDASVIYENTQSVSVPASGSRTVSFEDAVFGTNSSGTYLINAVVTCDGENYILNKILNNSVSLALELDKTFYAQGDTVNITGSIQNTGDFTLTQLPYVLKNQNIGLDQSRNFDFIPGQQHQITAAAYVPSDITAGSYDCVLSIPGNLIKRSLVIPRTEWKIDDIFDHSFNAGEGVDMVLHNTGGAASEYSFDFKLKDFLAEIVSEQTFAGTISAVSSGTLEFDLPSDLVSGNYVIGSSLKNIVFDVNGISAGSLLTVDRQVYTAGQSISAELSINNTGPAIDSASVILALKPAQETSLIYGMITDTATNDPIAGARVTSGNRYCFTNSNGEYRLDMLIPGEHTLTAEKTDYQPLSDTVISVPGSNTVNFQLQPSAMCTLSGSIYFAHDLSDASYVKVELEPVDADSSYVRKRAVYSKSGEYIFSDVAAGQYQLKITGASIFDYTQSITVSVGENINDVSVTALPEDILLYEGNDDMASAAEISCGTKGRGRIYPQGDKDYFRFYADEPSHCYFDLTEIPSNITKHLQVLDANGIVLKEKTYFYGGGSYSIDMDLLEEGYYYIMFSAASSNPASEDEYKFSFNIYRTYDPFEPDNSIASAAQAQQGNMYASLYPAGDHDFYKITLPCAGTVTVEMDMPGNISNTIVEVKLYDSSYSLLETKSYGYYNGVDWSRNFVFSPVSSAGDYYVEFSDAADNTYSIYPYKMNIHFVSSQDYTSSPAGLYLESIDNINIISDGSVMLERSIDSTQLQGSFILESTFVSALDQSISVSRAYFAVDGELIVPDPEPGLEVNLSVPEQVSRAEFDIITELTNTGSTDLTENVCYKQDCRDVTLEQGQSQTIKFTDSVIEDTQITVSVTGDIEETVVKQVDFDENVAISLSPQSVYEQGRVEIPYTLTNTGGFDSNVELILTLGADTQTRNYFIPVSQTVNDSVVYDLSAGDYSLDYQTPFGQGSVEVKTAEFNTAVLDNITASVVDGDILVDLDVVNTGYNQIKGKLTAQTGFAYAEQEIELAPQTSIYPQLALTAVSVQPGTYNIDLELIGQDAEEVVSGTAIVEIQPAFFEVTELNMPDNITAGSTVELSFTVKNTGGLAESTEFAVNMYDIYKDTRQVYLMPDQEEIIQVSFMLDDDLEAKVYHGEYSINGSKEFFDLDVKGIDIDVTARLDKNIYAENETAQLRVDVTDNSTESDYDMFLRVQYAGFEYEEPFTLETSRSLTLDVPVSKVENKLFYGIYTKDGRSIYLNTQYIYVSNADVGIYTDNGVYDQGGIVTYTVEVQEPGTLSITGPGDYQQTIEISGIIAESFSLPHDMSAGTYDLYYSFETDTGARSVGTCRFDVRGLELKILESELSSRQYSYGDDLSARIVFESNENFNGILKVWIVEPDGQSNQTHTRIINLTSGIKHIEELTVPLYSSKAGMQKFVFGLYNSEDELVCSSYEIYDFGGAVLIGAESGLYDYPVGDEDVELTLSVFGSRQATVRVFENESVIYSQEIEPSGFGSHNIQVRPVNKGIVDLTIEMDCDGAVSTKDIDFKYGHVSTPVDLAYEVDGQSVILDWQAVSDTDLAGYAVKYGTESGNYTSTVDVTGAAECRIDYLSPEIEYYAAVSACDTYGNESENSAEVSFMVESGTTPPQTEEADLKVRTFLLRWGAKDIFNLQGRVILPDGVTVDDVVKDAQFNITAANVQGENINITHMMIKALPGIFGGGDNRQLWYSVTGNADFAGVDHRSRPRDIELTFIFDKIGSDDKVEAERVISCRKISRLWKYFDFRAW